MAYPICEARLRNGKRCANVVFSIKSDDELHRRFCQGHARQAAEAAEAKQAADAEQDLVLEDVADDDVEPDEPGSGDIVEALAEVIASTPGTDPRDALRKAGLESSDLIGQFFKDALGAKKKVWFSCPSCKKRAQIELADWSSRTRALELCLDQGFGKPDAAPPLTEDEELLELIRAEMQKLSDKTMFAIGGLADFQQRLLDLPWEVQHGLADAADEDLIEVAQRNGYMLDPAVTTAGYAGNPHL